MIFTETDRLLLRNVAAKDADIMYDYRNNEICARYQRGQTKDYDWNTPSRRCFGSVGFRAYEKTEKGAKYRKNL